MKPFRDLEFLVSFGLMRHAGTSKIYFRQEIFQEFFCNSQEQVLSKAGNLCEFEMKV